MKRIVFALPLLAFAGLALAVPPKDPKVIHGMMDELRELHDAGIALHKDLDPAKKAELKTCQEKHADLPEQARTLRERAAKLPVLAYRVNLTMAANDAVACVACDTDGSACDSIPGALQRVQKQLDAPQTPKQ
ncbi:hypothetical protein [Alloalcanivorax mobilis]|uniref:hypothetical protein n=1 Tax=Alloalcanivorax mobilis TaxID=2019569 RepID=UPI000C792A38|nr:hypothetical protein [Alloalcanivorax mobilis]